MAGADRLDDIYAHSHDRSHKLIKYIVDPDASGRALTRTPEHRPNRLPNWSCEFDFCLLASTTDKRRQPHRTLAVLEIEYGRLTRAEIVTLP